MAKIPKRHVAYWYPIVLPILMAIMVAVPHVGWEYHVAREESEELKTAPKKGNPLTEETRRADYESDKSINNGDLKSNKDRDDFESVAGNKFKKPERIVSLAGANHSHDMSSRKKGYPSSFLEAEDVVNRHAIVQDKTSPIFGAVWSNANEALIVGVFAAYLHFFLVFLPSGMYMRRSADSDTAYVWVLVGTMLHFPFIFSIPYFHKMYGKYGKFEDLMISSALALISLLAVILIREKIWRKFDGMRVSGAIVVSDASRMVT